MNFEQRLTEIVNDLPPIQSGRINAHLQAGFNQAMADELMGANPINPQQLAEGVANGLMAILANIHLNVRESESPEAAKHMVSLVLSAIIQFARDFDGYVASGNAHRTLIINRTVGHS